jgi:hypothetical protein
VAGSFRRGLVPVGEHIGPALVADTALLTPGHLADAGTRARIITTVAARFRAQVKAA